jgi:glycosyltransferase involved in cell wall biosynthesis
LRVLIDGVTLGSRSGPNSFAKKISDAFVELGHSVTLDVSQGEPPNVRLLFIQGRHTQIPTAVRLDGIYFNTRQSWEEMNAPIRSSYESAELVIHQTDFDQRLIERYFGVHPRSVVIRNGADPRKTMATPALVHPALDSYAQTWVCASSWRPHKRLSENIRYFHSHASPNDCLVVAGDISQVADSISRMSLDRVFFVGEIDQTTLTSLYRRSSNLVHLAWLDHCPNVVVDARAAGCRIICSSSGGTEEVAGRDAIVVQEDEWDLTPIDLYSPPQLDFGRARQGRFESTLDIRQVAQEYLRELGEIAR